MKPRKDCTTCEGTGKIMVPVYTGDGCHEFEWEDCPECEEVNDLENEQVTK